MCSKNRCKSRCRLEWSMDTYIKANGLHSQECEKEIHNDHGQYAVAVKKNQTVVGHLLQKLSVCSLFMTRWCN